MYKVKDVVTLEKNRFLVTMEKQKEVIDPEWALLEASRKLDNIRRKREGKSPEDDFYIEYFQTLLDDAYEELKALYEEFDRLIEDEGELPFI